MPAANSTIARRFTTAGIDPLSTFAFVRTNARISNPDGTTVSEMLDIEIPAHWDQVAVDVLATKYFRKAGVPQVDADGELVLDGGGKPVLGTETSVRQWAYRLANAWKLWGEKGGYFSSVADAESFRDEIVYMLVAQMASPNSPQHFNTGLFDAYGITGSPDGNWAVDPETLELVETPDLYSRSAASACYIQSVADQLVGPGSIMDLWEREARLFKSGSGSGTNFSSIRGEGEGLSGGGKSSGLMSFLAVGDRSAGAIQSGGTTRRAAKMVILDADHPDVEAFINWKVREEEKVAALIAMGYSSDWQGEAYRTVSGQNSNNSIRLSKGFMQAMREGRDWHLINRTDGKVAKIIKADELWAQIADAAWRCADPGVQFDDIINEWATTPNDGPIRGSNPCSEYMHVDDTACNLASINLGNFYNAATKTFDTEGFRHAARLWTMVLEITVSMSHYPSEAVAKNSYEHRTLGLGYANVGALLMRAGIAYDSDAGRAVMAALTALMHFTAYSTSAEMAASIGPCLAYERNGAEMQRVLRNHRVAAYGGEVEELRYEGLTIKPVGLDHGALAGTTFGDLSSAVLREADRCISLGEEHGFRNMQATVLAPTGTIGLQMSCDTTGVEPDFALVKFKKLAGGGYMKLVNGSVEMALAALGYDQAAQRRIIDFALGTQSLDGDTAVNRVRLLEAGLASTTIDAIEAGIPTSMDLEFAATQAVTQEIGNDHALEGLDPSAPRFSLLTHLGFSPADIRESSLVTCGHQTVEGAPDLKPEHLSVFDCANYCGDGTRTIHWTGHVRALGAVAPFISGSVSKTINLPNEATRDDVMRAYELSYELGVKACAVYRDGSKLSQVLSSTSSEEDEANAIEETTIAEHIEMARRELLEPSAGVSPSAHYAGSSPVRFRLPTMVYGPRWKFNIGGTEVFLRTSEYSDGTCGEIWLDLSKEGSTLKGILACFAISVSTGLQYGVPLSKWVDMFVSHSFEPRGPVSGHANLKMANSIVDAVFRILGHHYLGREELVQVHGESPKVTLVVRDDVAAAGQVAVAQKSSTAAASAESSSTHVSMASPYTGDMCTSCNGFRMVKSGTCSTCQDCSATSGCS
jgi:ribonucleoside-diphosphate reductase alpha chain